MEITAKTVPDEDKWKADIRSYIINHHQGTRNIRPEKIACFTSCNGIILILQCGKSINQSVFWLSPILEQKERGFFLKFRARDWWSVGRVKEGDYEVVIKCWLKYSKSHQSDTHSHQSDALSYQTDVESSICETWYSVLSTFRFL